MRFDDFTELVRTRLEEICGPEFSVSVYEALKNNSVTHKGVSIKENGCNISPTIYLDEFYTDYCDGKDIEEIVNDVIRVYSENRLCPDLDVEKFSDYEWVRERIFFKLINAMDNFRLLQQVPHENLMDLAVVYGVYMGDHRGAFSSVLVRNEHMAGWKVSEEEIREEAMKNTPRLLPYQIFTMSEMLEGSGLETGIPENAIRMYVMTNRLRIGGASAMLYEGALRSFARSIGCDLFVIPSSVHELILIPDDGFADAGTLMPMIGEVNDTQLDREEILSYSLYRYDVEKDLMEIAASPENRKNCGGVQPGSKKVARA